MPYCIFSMMYQKCIKFHKHLADKIATKTNQRYEDVIAWIRCKLSFLIMQSAQLCLRGSRTVAEANEIVEDYGIACDDAKIH